MGKITRYFFIALISAACNRSNKVVNVDGNMDTTTAYTDTVKPILPVDSQRISNEPAIPVLPMHPTIKGVNRRELVDFAKTLTGIPYKYASTDPSGGFDCSGFITYVFNHFNIEVPRSSVDFTNVGEEINLINAKEGDLILFTGTVDSIETVGHMGIVTANADTLKFIHATSGRANGVTISGLTDHYKRRFVKVIRLFPD